MSRTHLFLLLLVCVALAGAEKAASQAGIPAQARAIDPERIRQHVRFLSHDLLEGRGTGQRGGDIAAEYIATQFALIGLEPAGDQGSFMQKVPLVGITTEPKSVFTLVHRGGKLDLKMGDEIVATDETQQKEDHVDAEIIYVGYGITAPEYKWDDYKGVDVKGKVLLMLVNEPPSDDPKFFTGKALTYYGRWMYKFEEAARHGAAAVLLVHKTGLDPYGWDVVRNSWSGERSYLIAGREDHLKAAARIHTDVARKLAAMSGMDFEAMLAMANSPDFKPVPLPVRFKADLYSHLRPFESSNVIARLAGADSKQRSQGVFYTAHYDHLGIRPDQPGDNIYNGAMDNASGCGILLEIARAYAASVQKPARSVYFAAVTAEEQGLLGSQYLGQHPPIPAGSITLDLNFDDVPAIGTPEETEVVGSERTTFYPVVEQTARAFGLTIMPDSRPEAGHYYRSDHFSFARVGIPAFSIAEGMKFKGHPREWGAVQANDYLAHRYHQPSDEYRPEMDFSGDAFMARFGFALGWKAASQQERIQWKPGDEFEAARKANQ